MADKIKTAIARSTSVKVEINKTLSNAHPVDRFNINKLVKKTQKVQTPEQQLESVKKAAEKSEQNRLILRLDRTMETLIEESARAKDEFINLCKTQMSYERTNASNIYKIKENSNMIEKIFQNLEQFPAIRKELGLIKESIKKIQMTNKAFSDAYCQDQNSFDMKFNLLKRNQEAFQVNSNEKDKRINNLHSEFNSLTDIFWKKMEKIEEQTNKELDELKIQMNECSAEQKIQENLYKEFQTQIKGELKKSIKEIYNKHKIELESLNRQEAALKSMQGLRKQIVIIEPMVKEMNAKFQQIQDIPLFIERSLPLMIHFQVSEALRETVCTKKEDLDCPQNEQVPIESKVKNYQMTTLKEILDYNDKTIGQAQEFNIFLFGKRLQILAKNFLKENQGIHGFRMGRDFHNKMRSEDRSIEFLRQPYLDSIKDLKQESTKNTICDDLLNQAKNCYNRLNVLNQQNNNDEIGYIEQKKILQSEEQELKDLISKLSGSSSHLQMLQNFITQHKAKNKVISSVIMDFADSDKLIKVYQKIDEIQNQITSSHAMGNMQGGIGKIKRQNAIRVPENAIHNHAGHKNAHHHSSHQHGHPSSFMQSSLQKNTDFGISKKEQMNKSTTLKFQSTIKNKLIQKVNSKITSQQDSINLPESSFIDDKYGSDVIDYDEIDDVNNTQQDVQYTSGDQVQSSKKKHKKKHDNGKHQKDTQKKIKQKVDEHIDNQMRIRRPRKQHHQKQQNQQNVVQQQNVSVQPQVQEQQNQIVRPIQQQNQPFQQQSQIQDSLVQQQTQQQNPQVQQNTQKQDTQVQQQTQQQNLNVQQQIQQQDQTERIQLDQKPEVNEDYQQITKANEASKALEVTDQSKEESNNQIPANKSSKNNSNPSSKHQTSRQQSQIKAQLRTQVNQEFQSQIDTRIQTSINNTFIQKGKENQQSQLDINQQLQQNQPQNTIQLEQLVQNQNVIQDLDYGSESSSFRSYGHEFTSKTSHDFPPQTGPTLIVLRKLTEQHARQLVRKYQKENKKLRNDVRNIQKNFKYMIDLLPQGQFTINELGEQETIYSGLKEIRFHQHDMNQAFLKKYASMLNSKSVGAQLMDQIIDGVKKTVSTSEFDQLVQHFQKVNKEKNAQIAKTKIKELLGVDVVIDSSAKEDEVHILRKDRSALKVQRLNMALINQMKLKQIEVERPMANEQINEVDAKHVQCTQQIVDQSIDWLRALLQTMLNSHFHDIQEMIKGCRIEMQQSSETFQARSGIVQKELIKCQKMLENIEIRFKDDNTDLLRFKQVVSSDVQIAINKMQEKVQSYQHSIKQSVHLASKHEGIIETILEANMIDNLLQSQEAEDRKNISLFGMKTNAQVIRPQDKISQMNQTQKSKSSQPLIDDKYISPQPSVKLSTQFQSNIDQGAPENAAQLPYNHPSHFLQQIKKACLAYSCSPVKYNGTEISHKDLVEVKKKLLLKAQRMYRNQNVVQNQNQEKEDLDKYYKDLKTGNGSDTYQMQSTIQVDQRFDENKKEVISNKVEISRFSSNNENNSPGTKKLNSQAMKQSSLNTIKLNKSDDGDGSHILKNRDSKIDDDQSNFNQHVKISQPRRAIELASSITRADAVDYQAIKITNDSQKIDTEEMSVNEDFDIKALNRKAIEVQQKNQDEKHKNIESKIKKMLGTNKSRQSNYTTYLDFTKNTIIHTQKSRGNNFATINMPGDKNMQKQEQQMDKILHHIGKPSIHSRQSIGSYARPGARTSLYSSATRKGTLQYSAPSQQDDANSSQRDILTDYKELDKNSKVKNAAEQFGLVESVGLQVRAINIQSSQASPAQGMTFSKSFGRKTDQMRHSIQPQMKKILELHGQQSQQIQNLVSNFHSQQTNVAGNFGARQSETMFQTLEDIQQAPTVLKKNESQIYDYQVLKTPHIHKLNFEQSKTPVQVMDHKNTQLKSQMIHSQGNSKFAFQNQKAGKQNRVRHTIEIAKSQPLRVERPQSSMSKQTINSNDS